MMKKLALILLFLIISNQSQALVNNTKGAPTTVADLVSNLQKCAIESGYESTTLVTELVSLDCSSRNLNNTTFDVFSYFINLNNLIIDDNADITSLKSLFTLNKLEHLSLANNLNVSLSDVNSLDGLRSLTVTINPLSPRISINKLVNLTDLTVVNSPSVNMGMFNLPQVQSVIIKGSGADIGPLFDKSSLVSLTLENSNIKNSHINLLIQIKELYLLNMGLTSIPDLSKLTLLEVLDVSDNPISDFTNLPQELVKLNLRGTNTGDCGGLNGNSIEWLEIGGPDFHNIDECIGVLNLKGLTIVDAPNLDAIQSVDKFGGFCGLSFTNTSLELLKGNRPVSIVYLIDNVGLSRNKLIKVANSNNNIHPHLIPRNMVINGSNSMQCGDLYERKDVWDKNPKLYMENKITTIVAGVSLDSPECPLLRIPDRYQMPDLCMPDAPSGFIATKGYQTEIYSLSWTKKHHDKWGVVNYDVRVNGDEVTSYDANVALPISIDLTTPIIGSRLNLASFEVRACNEDVTDPTNPLLICGDWQTTDTGCEIECTDSDLIAPTLTTPASNTSGDYSVNWSAGYSRNELQQSIGVNPFVTIQNDDSLSKSFVNQLNNTTYAYKVRGCTELNICSRYSSIKSVNVSLQVPTIGALPSVSTTGDYTVSWDPVAYDGSVERYKLQEKINNGTWVTISNIRSFSYDFINKPNGNNYSYQIKACRAGNNCSDFSTPKSINVQLQIPAFGALPSVSTTGDYTVSWNPVAYDGSVERYKLQEKINNGTWVTISNIRSFSYNFINKLNGNNYSYQIKACRADNNCSNFSAAKSISVQLPIPTMNNLASPNVTGSYTVSWQAVSNDSNVDHYQLQEKINNGDWNNVTNTTRFTRAFSGKSDASTYYYRIQACLVGNNCSNFSASKFVEVRFRPNTPTINVPGPISTNGIYTVSWNAQTYATRYQLQQKINNGSFITVQNTSALSKDFNNPSNDYSYRVRACNGTSVCSGYSSIGQITVDLPLPPPVIGNLDFIDTDGNYRVSWSSVAGTSYYIIDEKIGRGSWNSVNTGATRFKDYSHSTDSVNQYRVKSCNASNTCGDYSAIKKTILNIPQYASETPASINEIPAIESGSASIGTSGGSFQTDQMGQASYSLPIYAGIAAAGLSPKVSLNYSSSGGNGPLGVGWTISGVTVITRCRETEESRDGTSVITPKPITWTTDDKLCLNGERLFVATGDYWGNGSTYRTERDQFARVTYYSVNHLTIERKDGSIAYYGNTSDSNIKASVNGTTPTYAWAINRFQDNMSNYIDYTYNAGVNPGALEFVLTDIDYTGHLSTPVVTPYNKIHFTYESSRPDKTTAYIAGAQVEMDLRLSQVESKIDNTEVRSYTLNYATSISSSRSLIDSIMECRNATCLEPEQFEWTQPLVGFASETSGGIFPRNIKSSKLGDVNGDGRADLVFVDDNDNKFKIAYANGTSGFGIATSTNIFGPAGDEINNKWHLIDYNADGRQDLMKALNGIWVIHLAQSNNISFSNTWTPTGLTANNNDDFQIQDFNGDGLADLLYPSGGLSVRYLERQGTGYGFSSTQIGVDLPHRPEDIPGMPTTPNTFDFLAYRYYSGDDINIVANDVNGDGVADLILRTDVYVLEIPNSTQPSKPYQFISSGAQTTSRGEPMEILESSHWVAFIGKGLNVNNKLDYSSEMVYISESSLFSSADKKIRFTDINSDGLTDILSVASNSSWQYRLGTGTGFTDNISMSIVTNEDHVQLFDFNSDGYTDFIYPTDTGTHIYKVKTWDGNGFKPPLTISGTIANNLDTNVNFFLDLNGDGRPDHLRIDAQGSQKIQIRQNSYTPVDRITSFTNGFGANTSVYYEPLTFSSVYFQGTGANEFDYGNGSPVFDYLSSMYVVRSVTTDVPTESNPNNTSSMSYHYQAARVQAGGRGFLGFQTVTTSVPVNASGDATNYLLETQTTYHQDFPYIGFPESVTVSQTEVPFDPPINQCLINPADCFPPSCYPGQICFDPQRGASSMMLSQTINTVDSAVTVGNAVFTYIDTTTEQTFSPESGSLLKTRYQSTSHDDYGNPSLNRIKIYEGSMTTAHLRHTTDTFTNYDNNISNWDIGLLRAKSVTVSRPSQINVNTTTQYDYFSNGLLSEERRLPNDGFDKFLRIRHKYDNFGNEIKTISCSKDLTVSQCDNTSNMQPSTSANPTLVHRYNELIFDAKGRYANQIRNSLGQIVTSVISRDIYGNAKTSSDLNGTITTNRFNTLGGLESSYSSLGTWTYTSKKWCISIGSSTAISCPPNALFRVTDKTQGGAASYSFFDKLGRKVATTDQAFNTANNGGTSGDDQWVLNNIYYDKLGRTVKAVGPYFNGASNKPISYSEYDRYNRSTKSILPDGAFEIIAYNDFTMVTTNALFQTKTEVKNVLGELSQVQDDIGGKLNYTYNSQGLLTEVRRTTDGLVELLIQNTYDKAGRKTNSQSVDTGTTISEYNAEGEVVSVTDNKGQIFDTYRDTMGRAYLTETFDQFSIKQTSYNYTFNTSTNLLEREIDFMSPEAYQRRYTYDNRKRLQSVSIVIDDTEDVCDNGGVCNFVSYNYYDKYSRSLIQQDVSGKAVENVYNNKGYLSTVKRKDNSLPTKEYYKLVSTDARGNITSDRKSANLYSTYQYDVDRGFMTGITSGSVGTNQSYQYDVLGNILKRADGTKSECFAYDDLNRMTATHRSNGASCTATSGNAQNTTIGYDGRGNITQKDGMIYNYDNALPNAIGNSPHQVQSKGSQSFDYDDNGNNTLTTSFDSPSHGFVNRNIEYTTFDKIEHVYLGSAGNPIEQAFYKYDTSNNRYARVDIDNAGDKKVTFFMGNTQVEYSANGNLKHKRQLGNYAILEEYNGSSTDRYMFTDHLGSVDKITDANGGLVQAMSFSAWGERRLPSSWEDNLPLSTLEQLSNYTTSGFTGHEMVDAFGIINMGGRIYDAALGRMLQADPFVQDPTNTQSFNRYTYVYNNPLSYTDPSGYFSLRQAIGMIVGIVLSIWLGPLVHAFWAGFISGFVSSFIITGNLKTALKAGIIAGAVAFVGDKLFSSKGEVNSADGTPKAKGGAGEIADKTAKSGSAPGSTTGTSSNGANIAGESSSTTTTARSIGKSSVDQSQQVATEVADDVIAGEGALLQDKFIMDLLESGQISPDVVDQWADQLYRNGIASGADFTNNAIAVSRRLRSYAAAARIRSFATDNFNTFLGEVWKGVEMASYVAGGIGLARGAARLAVKQFASRKAILQTFCFIAGTKVHTKDGLKNIEDIKVGDLVLSKDESTGEIEYKAVKYLSREKDKKILNVSILNANGEQEIISATTDHPFWVKNKGWTKTQELKLNDKLLNAQSDLVKIESIEIDEQLHNTYNFEVADFNTYFVGNDGVWVHNNTCYPELNRVVNSKIAHASTRGVEHGVFKDLGSGKQALKDLSDSIRQSGFPEGTIRDLSKSNTWLVPTGNKGLAVFNVSAKGTARLRTTLIAR